MSDYGDQPSRATVGVKGSSLRDYWGLQLTNMSAQYEALAGELGEIIRTGELAPGARLPSIPDLARERGMSQSNVRLAFQHLQAAGLITTVQGRGTFVRLPVPRVTRDATARYAVEKQRAWSGDPAELHRAVLELDSPEVNSDEIEIHVAYSQTVADEQMADRFGIEVGAELLERIFETELATQHDHMSIVRSYLPVDLIKANPLLLDESNEPWPGGTMHQLATVGIEVDQIIDEVIARPPTVAEADHLGLGPGVSVFELQKIMIDVSGKVVEVGTVVFPGDRTLLRYTTKLPRWPVE